MSHNLKIVEPTVNGPREALARAIDECRDADARAAKAHGAVATASRMLDEAQRAHKAAQNAIDAARAVQRPLAELLAEAGSDYEREQLVDERNASKGRPAVTAEDLRDARALVLDAEDRIIVARSELDQLQQTAISTEAAARRADARRRAAINEVVRPECARLMQTAERLARDLGEARLALRHISDNLVDPHADERRQIDRFLNRDFSQLFPEEFGFKAEPSMALAAWKAFAGAIERDPSTPFPA
jgi:hypothetical protein